MPNPNNTSDKSNELISHDFIVKPRSPPVISGAK